MSSVTGGCPTLGCGGSVNFAAPGRGHVPGCLYPTTQTNELEQIRQKNSDDPMEEGLLEEQRTGEDR